MFLISHFKYFYLVYPLTNCGNDSYYFLLFLSFNLNISFINNESTTFITFTFPLRFILSYMFLLPISNLYFQPKSLNIFCKASLVVINSFSLCFSEKLFISASLLNNNFTGESSLDWNFFFQLLLKNLQSYGSFFVFNNWLPLVIFNIFFLSLTFSFKL